MIYFVAAVDVDAVKVGTTSSPARLVERMKDLQVGSPVLLKLLKTIDGGRAEEKTLHGRWDAHRLHGEWFRLSPIASEIGALVAVEAKVAWSCPTCGKPKSNRPKRGRACLCRSCTQQARGRLPMAVHEARARCVDCGAPTSVKGHSKGKGAKRCKPCSMRRAWSDPMYHHRHYLARVEAGLAAPFVLVFCECGERLGRKNTSGRCFRCAMATAGQLVETPAACRARMSADVGGLDSGGDSEAIRAPVNGPEVQQN